VTSRSQKVTLDALREYKRENLRQARMVRDSVREFERRMALDDAIEIAMQEIMVAQ
jgi:hypothetical protein